MTLQACRNCESISKCVFANQGWSMRAKSQSELGKLPVDATVRPIK